jgi:phage head maturation protease
VIGYIDPASMRETAEGLEVSGHLDINTSDTAREAWRSMKNNAMSLSFGYVTTRQRKRRDGITELHELDLFEISIVPAPANSDTRVIAMKALDIVELADADALTDVSREWADLMTKVMDHTPAESLRQKSERIARELAPVTVASFEC